MSFPLLLWPSFLSLSPSISFLFILEDCNLKVIEWECCQTVRECKKHPHTQAIRPYVHINADVRWPLVSQLALKHLRKRSEGNALWTKQSKTTQPCICVHCFIERSFWYQNNTQRQFCRLFLSLNYVYSKNQTCNFQEAWNAIKTRVAISEVYYQLLKSTIKWCYTSWFFFSEENRNQRNKKKCRVGHDFIHCIVKNECYQNKAKP